MVILILSGALVGILCGLRFKVFVLFPLLLGAALLIAIAGMAGHYGAGAVTFAIVGIWTSVQLGYLVGCFLEASVAFRGTSDPEKGIHPAIDLPFRERTR
jgi:uncharacterized membrane protein